MADVKQELACRFLNSGQRGTRSLDPWCETHQRSAICCARAIEVERDAAIKRAEEAEAQAETAEEQATRQETRADRFTNQIAELESQLKAEKARADCNLNSWRAGANTLAKTLVDNDRLTTELEESRAENEKLRAGLAALERLEEGAIEQRDSAIKRAEEAELDAATERASRNTSEREFRALDARNADLRTENEKLRAELSALQERLSVSISHEEYSEALAGIARLNDELATVAERQREACVKAAEDWAWRFQDHRPATDIIRETPLVTDAPGKSAPKWDESMRRNCVPLRDEPAPKPEELCASGPCELESDEGRCGAPGQLEYLRRKFDGHTAPVYRCAKHRKATNECWEPAPPKSRCTCDAETLAVPTAERDCPEHGVNRPGQTLDEWTDELIAKHKSLNFTGVVADHWRQRAVTGIERRDARIRELEADLAQRSKDGMHWLNEMEQARVRVAALESELATLRAFADRAAQARAIRWAVNQIGNDDLDETQALALADRIERGEVTIPEEP